MPEPKPVGTLTPLAPIKPVGELKPLNQASTTDQAYQDLIAHKNDPQTKQIQNTWGDQKEEEPGFGSSLLNSLATGSARLGSMLARTPALIYDLALMGTDALVNTASAGINAVADTDLRTDYQTTSEDLARQLGLPENKVAKYYDQDVKQRQAITAQKYDKGITDYFANGELKKGFGLLANSVAESAPTTIALLMGNAAGVSTAGSILGGGAAFAADKKAELDQQAPELSHDTKMNIAVANGLFEGLFEQFGITKLGSLTKNILLKEGKDAAKKVAEEGFKDVYKPVAKKYLGTAAEESISEAATQFAQNAVDKYSGYKPEMDLMQGVVDAGIVGLGAGSGYSAIPAALEANQQKKEEKIAGAKVKKDAERSKFAYDIAQKSDEAIQSFKENVQKQVQNGTLTQEQAAHALTRVNSYKEYNDIVGALNLSEEQKLEVFDKTYQKQNLESELRDLGEPGKLHPLKQAEYTIKEKLANDLQKDITEILLKAQIKRETTVGKKTIEELAKKEQKETEKPKEGVVKPKGVLKGLEEKYKARIPEETRSFEQFQNHEYNDTKLNARVKHKITSEWLERQPEHKVYGTLVERPFEWNGKGSTVLGIELPGGKKLRFASSMERVFEDKEGGKGIRGHFRQERFNEEFPVGTPIGVKVYNLKDEEGETTPHIKAFRQDNGKFIGWMKATNTGSSNPDTVLKEQLDHLETVPEHDNTPGMVVPEKKPKKPIAPVLEKKKINPKLEANVGTKENTTNRKKPAAGNNNPASKSSISNSSVKTTTLRTGTKKTNRKIKDPELKMALRSEVFTPYDLTIQHFINGAQVNHADLKKFFKNTSTIGYSHKEVGKRIGYRHNKGKTIDQIAHDLWEEHPDLNYDIRDWRNAVDEVITNFHSTKSMAQDLNRRNNKVEPEQFSEEEKEMGAALDKIENDRLTVDTENVVDALENLTDEELIALSKKNAEEFGKWEEGQDIIKDNGKGPVFQKESILDNDRLEKIVETIKTSFPKVKVEYDDELEGAGQLEGNTIKINPYYAGEDTPIHEGAHVYLDALENNDPKLYKRAVDQLRDTPLWKEIESNPDYETLDEKGIANEVLAETIGREGAGIFDDVEQENKFIKSLNDIFDWLKLHLGLEKNIAKNLARKILTGKKTKELTGKTGETKNQNFNKKDFEYFREKQLKRNIDKENAVLTAINDMLDEEISDEERADLEQDKESIMQERLQDKKEYDLYKKEIVKLKNIEMAESLEGFTLDDLIEAYNTTRFYSESIDRAELKDIREKIGYFISQQGRERLEKHRDFIAENANTKDLDFFEVWTKALSHMSENFPELQEMSKIFDDSYLKMQQERTEKKKTLKKLADAVIKEKNEKLGFGAKAKSLVFHDTPKYFDFMDDGTGHFVSGEGLTNAQKDFLDYIKELTKERQLVDEDGNILDNEVIKIDPGFHEKYDTWIGKTWGFFKMPATAYLEQRENAKSAYSSVYNGRLTNKFNKPRPKDKGYSKDFYKAAQLYIDDYTHVKHMSKMVALVDSISLLNERGYGEQLAKPGVVKFLKEWSQEQIYKAPKTTTPALDLTLKVLRRLTSMIVMGFNIPASIMNAFIGNYNNWRKDVADLGYGGLKSGYVGNKRFFSKKGFTILQHYNVIDSDFDSNPQAFAGKLFDMLAYGAQRYGEMQIQGSMFLSQLKPEEWNNFVYKDGELKIKDEQEMADKMNTYKNNVSDVQGKYSEKDRRNFMRGEFGKALTEFKTWMPDFLKERLGKEYIDRNNVTHIGTYRMFTKQAIKDIKEDWSNGNILGVGKQILKNKQMAQNLKGALFIAGLLVYKYSGDDEDKKTKRKVLSMENAIGNLLFIFDPEQLKYTIGNPVAIQGTVLAFIDVLVDIKKLDSKKSNNGNKLKKDLLKITPYKKIVKPLIEEKTEDLPKKILLGQ